MTKRPIALLIALALAAAPALAQAPLPEDETPELPRPPATEEEDTAPEGEAAGDGSLLPEVEGGREAQLDALFDRLDEAEAREARVIQSQIWRVWRRSGSDSMNLLLRRGMEAIEAEDHDAALVHLNDLVRLAPDFAEGWNQRATVHFLRGDYGKAMQDIEAVLALEPRHFGALAGLGIILDRTGYDAGALRAYRRALEVNPHLDGARKGIDKLAPDVDGRDT
jgi:tetratricopeptide (TPR) repeat protein